MNDPIESFFQGCLLLWIFCATIFGTFLFVGHFIVGDIQFISISQTKKTIQDGDKFKTYSCVRVQEIKK